LLLAISVGGRRVGNKMLGDIEIVLQQIFLAPSRPKEKGEEEESIALYVSCQNRPVFFLTLLEIPNQKIFEDNISYLFQFPTCFSRFEM
jgi:hypothetical protein